MQAGCFAWRRSDRARGGRLPTAGLHEPLRHTARNDGTDRRRRGDTRADGHALPTDGARSARKKAATGRRKPAAFVPKQAAFFVAAGARRQKAEKQRETTDAITERTKTINFSPPNHQQKHVFTPCTSGEMQAEIRTFRRLGRQPGGRSIHFISRLPERKTKKNRQRTGGCAANCAFSRFDPLTLSTRPTIARVDAKNQRFAISSRGAQWAKNARYGCAIPRFSCKSDDKKRLFRLRRPLIPF